MYVRNGLFFVSFEVVKRTGYTSGVTKYKDQGRPMVYVHREGTPGSFPTWSSVHWFPRVLVAW